MINNRTRMVILIIVWAIMLGASLLPRVISQEIFQRSMSFSVQSLLAGSVILLGFLGTFLWPPLIRIRSFLVIFLVLVVAEGFVYTVLDSSLGFPARLHDPQFNVYMLAEQSLQAIVTVVIIAAMLMIHKKPSACFLRIGDISAESEPVKWLGIPPKTRWSSLGWILAVAISLGTVTFLLLAGSPSTDMLIKVMPFVPVVLLSAALNAFSEEVSYKASFLSVLEGQVGRRQSLLLTAAYFGISHYYGVPYGIIGVILATFLGWILSKSMLETRGLFWAWIIHFFQDVFIFLFLAIGSITPGGI